MATKKDILPDLTDLSINELQELLDTVSEALEAKKDVRRLELLAELEKLGGVPATPRRGRTPTAIGEPSPQRASPKVQFRGPNGEEWSGRGAMPRWCRELGITDKAGLEQYRVTE